jgi:hypothetical protein
MPSGEHGAYPDDQVVALAAAFQGADIPFAYGGANALFYFGEPRGTTDVDINNFLPAARAGAVLRLLQSLGCQLDLDAVQAEADAAGQVRVLWGTTFIDLFFAYAPFHDSVAQRVRTVSFGDVLIPVISAEDLVVFKALFNRPRDWADIAMLLEMQGRAFDFHYVHTWVVSMVGEDDSRVRRLASLTTGETDGSR